MFIPARVALDTVKQDDVRADAVLDRVAAIAPGIAILGSVLGHDEGRGGLSQAGPPCASSRAPARSDRSPRPGPVPSGQAPSHPSETSSRACPGPHAPGGDRTILP